MTGEEKEVEKHIQTQDVKFAEKYENLFFVIGSLSHKEHYIRNDAFSFTSSQVNVIDGNTDEVVGKLTFKVDIQQMQLKSSYLITSFSRKVFIHCVKSLQLVDKLDTLETACFDTFYDANTETLKIAC